MAHIQDLIGLNACSIAKAPIVGDESDLVALLRPANQRLSIAGSRHSQGGHTVSTDASMIITEAFNAITYDTFSQTVTAEAGASWSNIHHVLNPFGRSIPVQQSSPYFTIGGSISVNCHGRDPSKRPLSDYIQSLDVMNPQGVLLPGITRADALFKAVVGGYGNCGVIVRATLITCANDLLKRQYRYFKTVEEYVNELDRRDNAPTMHPQPQLHHAMLNFSAPTGPIEKVLDKTAALVNAGVGGVIGAIGGLFGADPAPTEPAAPKADFLIDLFCVDYYAVPVGELPEPMPVPTLEGASWIKSDALNVAWQQARTNDTFRGMSWELLKGYFAVPQIDYRNRWLREDVNFSAHLPADRQTVDMLQEYFIPRDQLALFITPLRALLMKHKVTLLNATLRVVRQETTGTYLSYCDAGDRMCLAIDFVAKLKRSADDVDGKPSYEPDENMQWVKQAIKLALDHGGSYYLPYYPFASVDQFKKAYPAHTQSIAAGSSMHYNKKLTNRFVEKYLS